MMLVWFGSKPRPNMAATCTTLSVGWATVRRSTLMVMDRAGLWDAVILGVSGSGSGQFVDRICRVMIVRFL